MTTGDAPARSFQQRFRAWYKKRLPIFWDNWVSAAGSMIALVAVFLLVLMFFLYLYNMLVGRESNPYVDLIGFMILPVLLSGGLVLLVLGNLLRRAREKREGRVHTETMFAGKDVVRRAVLVAGGTFVLLIGIGLFSYEAYHYTDSNQFCSYVCHEVMIPEATAHASSPHANVKCVDCHIGPGADWFVRAKLSGIRQVFAVLSDDFHRPIPTPVENLRPARETCEVCHWPAKFHGSRLVTYQRYAGDRDNSAQTTALVLHVGGPGGAAAGTASGIHWHVDPGNEVRYRHVDRERLEIVEVVQSTPAGEIRYLRDDADQHERQGSWRVMDCLDCHNRPTHIYDLPHRAVDLALATGKLDSAVPWLRRQAERVLREIEPDSDTAALVADRLRAIYAAEYPGDLAALEASLPATAAALAAILERNVWPRMRITWNTYPSHLSHFDEFGEFGTGGCFRCHDGRHEAATGAMITTDCDACHAVLAMEERNWDGLQGITAEAFLRR
jgi:hypothetical protein